MLQNKCGRSLGPYQDAVCYKETEHEGKCYKSFGCEAEDIMQALLAECGCRVVKGTIHEDCVLKIDFWVFGKEAEKVNGGNEFLPIQFTVDPEAACGTKGIEALKNGIIIVCIRGEMIMEWEKSHDSSLKEKIYQQFWGVVHTIAQARPYMKYATPKTKLVRFELAD